MLPMCRLCTWGKTNYQKDFHVNVFDTVPYMYMLCVQLWSLDQASWIGP